MKESKVLIKSSDLKNWVYPQCSLTQEEFLTGIHKAENGQFNSVQQSMKNFESWLKSKAKK